MHDLNVALVSVGGFKGVILFEDVDEGVLPFLYVVHEGDFSSKFK